MNWQDTLIESLKKSECRVISYVGDSVVAPILTRLEDDPYFTVVPATREDEAIGIVTGAYLCKSRGAVFLQSSGVGNSINALGSVNVAWRVPVPIFVTLRGQLTEPVMAQSQVGRALPAIFNALNISYFELDREDEALKIIEGALVTCYGTRNPVAVLITSKLTGGKKF